MKLNNFKLLMIVGILGTGSLFSYNVSADEYENNEIQSIKLEEGAINWENATKADEPSETDLLAKTPRASQAKTLNLGSNGTLTSNAWRTTGNGFISGNTRQWEYQVSAVYNGNKPVSKIRTTWKGTASLRNSANFSLGKCFRYNCWSW